MVNPFLQSLSVTGFPPVNAWIPVASAAAGLLTVQGSDTLGGQSRLVLCCEVSCPLIRAGRLSQFVWTMSKLDRSDHF